MLILLETDNCVNPAFVSHPQHSVYSSLFRVHEIWQKPLGFPGHLLTTKFAWFILFGSTVYFSSVLHASFGDFFFFLFVCLVYPGHHAEKQKFNYILSSSLDLISFSIISPYAFSCFLFYSVLYDLKTLPLFSQDSISNSHFLLFISPNGLHYCLMCCV